MLSHGITGELDRAVDGRDFSILFHFYTPLIPDCSVRQREVITMVTITAIDRELVIML